jgi:hypothetical protein
MSGWAVILLGPAWAGGLVLHDGPAEDAVRAVGARSGEPLADLRPVSLGDWIGGGSAPVIVGSPQPTACSGGPLTEDVLRETIAEVETLVEEQGYGLAVTTLDGVLASLPCLSEPVDPLIVGRLWYLRGVIACVSGDPEGGTSAFLHAIAFQPSLKWDARIPPTAGQKVFDAAVRHAPAPDGALLLGPGVAGTWAVSVDGQPAPDIRVLGVAGGEHLVQLTGPAIRTLPLHMGDTPLVLLTPSALGPGYLSQVTDPGVAQILAIIAESHTTGDPVWLVADGRVWRLDASGLGWEELREPAPVAKARRAPVGAWMAVGGGAIAVAGGGLFGLSTARGIDWMNAWNEASPGSSEEAESLGYWEQAREAQRVYGAVAVGGLVLAGLGLGLEIGGHPATVTPMAESPGLRVAVAGF